MELGNGRKGAQNMRSVVQELLRRSPAFRFRSLGRLGKGYGLRRPVRLPVGVSGAGSGPNAVRPYVARGGEVWRIIWASPRFGLRPCDFNQLGTWGLVCSPLQSSSTTPSLGAPPLLI
jgi:hypothetical protein